MRLAVFALIIPLIAACDDTEATGPVVPVAQASVATTGSNRFSPGVVNLEEGGTVTWGFNAVGHNVTFDVQGSPGNIGTTINQQVSRTFPTPGSFPYHCTVHGSSMSGTIIVHADAP